MVSLNCRRTEGYNLITEMILQNSHRRHIQRFLSIKALLLSLDKFNSILTIHFSVKLQTPCQ